MPSLHTRQKALNQQSARLAISPNQGRKGKTDRRTGSGPFYARKTINGKMTWKKLYAETFQRGEE